MSFGQLAKYTSHMYKHLTPEEKATWEARAAQDKARYSAELAQYEPPPGHDAKGILIEDQRPRRKNKRGPKDPMAPKRASGAYVFFTNEMRPKVLSEYPGIKFVELGKVLGERWRALTPDQKKRYEDMASQDKVRFQVEMQEYTARQAAENPPHPPSASEAQDHFGAYHDPTLGTTATVPSGYETYTQSAHHPMHHDPYAQATYAFKGE
jgi:HMG (high mobility group) box